jgi:hypothetical protein
MGVDPTLFFSFEKKKRGSSFVLHLNFFLVPFFTLLVVLSFFGFFSLSGVFVLFSFFFFVFSLSLSIFFFPFLSFGFPFWVSFFFLYAFCVSFFSVSISALSGDGKEAKEGGM